MKYGIGMGWEVPHIRWDGDGMLKPFKFCEGIAIAVTAPAMSKILLVHLDHRSFLTSRSEPLN